MSTTTEPSDPAGEKDTIRPRESGVMASPSRRRRACPTSSIEELSRSRPLVTLKYWPIVLLELPKLIDDEGIEVITSTIESAFEREEPFIVIGDTGHMRLPPSAIQRRRLASFAEENEHRTRRHAHGTAYVITNTVVRGAINALHWLFRPSTAINRFRSRADAVEWCVRSLADAGIDARASGSALLRDSQLNREFAVAV